MISSSVQPASHAAPAPRVIAVASGKGGVGKTFFSLQLAARAAEHGRRVLLMDADLGLANADVMLGISAPCSIQQVLAGERQLEDAVVEYRHEQGGPVFDILPGGSGLHDLTTLNGHQQQVILDEISALGSRYETIIIDTAAGIGDNVLYFVSASESALIVLTPDPTSLTDAYALIKVLSRQRDMDHFMVVVNQADEVEAQIVFRRLLAVADRYLNVHLDFAGHVARSPDIRRAIQSQQPFSGDAPNQMQAALDRVLEHAADSHRSGGLRFFWQHALHDGLQEAAAQPDADSGRSREAC